MDRSADQQRENEVAATIQQGEIVVRGEDEDVKNVRELIKKKSLIVERLRVRADRMGVDAPPNIEIEIEELSGEISNLRTWLIRNAIEARSGDASVFSRNKEREYLVVMRDNLVNLFDDTDLQDLCFDMGIDYESLPGRNKRDKAREIVSYCDRRGIGFELQEIISRLRPYSL
jgi:Effector-associated domain 7